ncbi:MAG: nucleoside deaminase [Pseudomonadota bacterium]|nr:nucleoside deaminase [Pseudomonadota bacterium]
MKTSRIELCERILDVIESDIIPRTVKGVAAGNKIFGAAILRKQDLSLVVADTNSEIENPLLHGEISTLNSFFDIPKIDRPKPENCIFISTHEPCSLCLSAITWANFDNFYYFFGYNETRDSFNIPHDLNILEEVFRIKHGQYSRTNKYWDCKDIISLVSELPTNEGKVLKIQIERIKNKYIELSDLYQSVREKSEIPLF